MAPKFGQVWHSDASRGSDPSTNKRSIAAAVDDEEGEMEA